MTRLAVTGALGRMGRRLLALIREADDLELAAAVERPGHPEIGADSGTAAGAGPNGVPLTAGVEAALQACDAAVDFSSAAAVEAVAAAARRTGTPLVVGTTGLGPAQEEALARAAERVPVLTAANMSVGINLLLTVLPVLARTLGPEFDVEIVEAHHRHKKDAPSGTALRLARAVAEALGLDPDSCLVHGRRGADVPRREGTVGMHAVRGGEIVGDHTVWFCGPDERIEVTHRAASRDVFARGALRAARWIVGRPAGRYTMLDVLGLGPVGPTHGGSK